MKRFLGLILVVVACNLWAAQLPDNIYFRAMNDEMQRSKKQLHIENNAKPLYIAYRVRKPHNQTFSASMGVLRPYTDPSLFTTDPKVSVYMYSGDFKNNSSFFRDDFSNDYVEEKAVNDSYEALRDQLWRLSDEEYVSTSKLAEEKAAVKRNMQAADLEAEFSKAPQAHFVQDLPAFTLRDRAFYEDLVKQISAQGKKYDYLEGFAAEFKFSQTDLYFLDSEGNFSQDYRVYNRLSLWAKFRNKDGYVIELKRSMELPIDESKIAAFAWEKSAAFLADTAKQQKAQKAEFYAGPVLLKPDAAEDFFMTLLISNIVETKNVLSVRGYRSTNKLVHKINHRIMTPVLDVFDRPLEREFNGFLLRGFMPVDAEGVAAQPLHIVEGGKLKELPTVRSLIKGQKQSNGHAVWFASRYPVAWYTNLFFEPKNPLPVQELEQKLMQLCREQELEYCYIIHGGEGVKGLAERVYVSDGHREPVYGFVPQLSPSQMRPLRDIVAAGDDMTLGSSEDTVMPSILVSDMELLPIEKKPDRKPFVKKP